ncbi:hypothetical protein F5Y12DRAFT_624130 [Xylaria sp. FL1777]|nr:hypothetical protein F5Y12DRAFT_624130 [Xylaria sp. FL1777]
MSQKITSKNLTYDTSLPPFLARLRGQQTARSGPDPILAAHRRPGQKRSASEEAEDAPVVVDEDGNVISLKDGVLEGEDKRESGEENDKKKDGPHEDEEGDPDLAQRKEKEKVAGIGGSRKRKVGRVIGEEHSEGEGREKTKTNKKNTDDDDKARIAKASADVRRLISRDDDSTSRSMHPPTKASDDKSGTERNSRQEGPQQKTIKGVKKKAIKKIKLSFENNDDGE